MKRKLIISLTFCLGLLFSPNIAMSNVTFNIVSDTTWKSSTTSGVGWEHLPGFDDSGWNSTIVKPSYPYPPTNWWPGTSAMHMWDPSENQDVYFRKTLFLPNAVASAVAKIRVDDGFYLYVNGTQVDSYTQAPWGYSHTVNITPYLHSGANVFAIYAWDVITINRSVTFDATVSIVPAPGALCLGSIGLAFARWIRKRQCGFRLNNDM